MSDEGTDLALRQRVATFDGYHDFTTHVPQNRISAREDVGGRFVEIPYYELSLDAIAEACDRHNVGFQLKGWVDDKEGYKHYASYSGDDIAIVGGTGFTRAIAVCHLFVAVMTERSRQKERAMERDRLGRKIAEEALELASQHPDFERGCSDLDLRQKVATLVGWTDFYRGESQQWLWGVPPLGASTKNTTVPPYELDTDPIIGALISSDIMYERLTLCDHIDVPNKNLVYVDRSTSITTFGKTPAIALCNLFVAVMEARLAGNNFSSKTQEPLIREEFVRIKTPFTRSLLKQIREKAKEHLLYQEGSTWRCAYGDLEIAADKLDAMLAREEWAKKEYGGEEKE